MRLFGGQEPGPLSQDEAVVVIVATGVGLTFPWDEVTVLVTLGIIIVTREAREGREDDDDGTGSKQRGVTRGCDELHGLHLCSSSSGRVVV